ncbi:ANL family adenylate-forming protein [Rothia kristinae]|uniref:AMP-dependent synthetase/ligase domain-containing protein n=1 Tax=Rothia kristinae TaxID=37923 RepID=A0A199NT76_9MICC|nr:fatty acid--CoA ligase family protein [Rothia kristinae]MBE8526434.1 long-chain fatty acid--CoA ligase [Amycolatopsis sp. H6(2020)]MED6045955.1 fatty acid--CoA ligase family protein [Rothia kristinae]OAX51906.1 hypothetical protein AN277_0206140 [Rothia kristinae]
MTPTHPAPQREGERGSLHLESTASGITLITGSDHAEVLERALRLRADGGIPLIGDERWSPQRRAQILERAAAASPEEGIGWAACTSGSTGTPKILLRTPASWEIAYPGLDRLIARAAGWSTTAGRTLLLPVHPVSSMGPFAAVHAAHSGMRLRVPRGVRITAEDLAGADLLHGTPWHLREVLDLLDAQGAFSHRLRVAVIGGDRVDPALRAEAERRGIAVLGYYGAAELSLVAVDDGSGLRAFPGVRLRVRRGVLWVRTEQAARQLIGGVSTLRREESEDGVWLSVGDRARLSEDGVLALCGREDQAILTAGATVTPEAVEAVLLASPLVDRALVYGAPHPRLGQLVAACIQPSSAASELSERRLRRKLRAWCARRLDPAQRPRRWLFTAALPRTPSGKPRRLRPAEVADLPPWTPSQGSSGGEGSDDSLSLQPEVEVSRAEEAGHA